LRSDLRSIALLSLIFGAASLCSAHPITWTINGTFNDGGTVSGTFIFDPDLGAEQTISTFNVAVSGGNTTVFFPYDFTPANSLALGPITGPGQFVFESDSTYIGGRQYILQFVPASPLSDAGGVVNINVASGYSANCFDCAPFRVFVRGTITPAGTPLPTPAPPSLLLMLAGLACAGLYAARHRLRRV